MRLLPQGDSLFVLAPAKINLSLKVLGRRDDGYHELQTVMASVGLYDTLRFAPAEESLSLRVHSLCRSVNSSPVNEIPVDDRNLVIKAARLLQAETGARRGADITLWKRIPSEAGLGGGSSDAAATLVGLNQFWNLQLNPEQLHALAARLGSDVNFFLDSQAAALCTGRGEKIETVPLPQPFSAVIIKPPSGLSTAKVFQQWSRDQVTSSTPVQTSVIENDLQEPARRLNPEIDQLLARLQRQDVLKAGMTGSGSACFAICRTARQARTLAGRCRSWRMGQVFVVSSGV
ncbi:4-(cytidine 5'-diphospho)-2-C-methyl-D-erythritol kinase [Planctomicrobium sp. SH661]|uniref:4-(cytidine 5'-diphospho)-2-C-methyl-D-erythritol kinase n=1 Tax=Planctomicrobium sp. SH661 TaxID=3448124 RepID=UPI003F5C7AC6